MGLETDERSTYREVLDGPGALRGKQLDVDVPQGGAQDGLPLGWSEDEE